MHHYTEMQGDYPFILTDNPSVINELSVTIFSCVHLPKETFQEQVNREMAYREEMSKQLQVVRGKFIVIVVGTVQEKHNFSRQIRQLS